MSVAGSNGSPTAAARSATAKASTKSSWRWRGTITRVNAEHACPLSVVDAGSNFVTTSSIGMSSRRSEEHTSELQSLMRISYAVFCLKQQTQQTTQTLQ